MNNLLFYIIFFIATFSVDASTVEVALSGKWKELDPNIYSNRNTVLIIKNIYDSIIDFDPKTGNYSSGILEEWSIIDGGKKYILKLNNKVQFSNGEVLNAQILKNSWLRKNTESLLFFSTNKAIINIPSKFTVEVVFDKAYPNFINDLTDLIFSPVLNKNDKELLGTGKFMISKKDVDVVELVPNPYSSTKGDYKILFYNGRINQNKVPDIYTYFPKKFICPNGFKCIYGNYRSHNLLSFNQSYKGALNTKVLRRSFIGLLYGKIKDELYSKEDILGVKRIFEFDPQIFLPFQGGRLSRKEVDKLISYDHGAAYLKKRPKVSFIFSNRSKLGRYLFNTMKKDTRFRLTDSSGPIEFNALLNILTNKKNVDMILHTHSIQDFNANDIYNKYASGGINKLYFNSNKVLEQSIGEVFKFGVEPKGLLKNVARTYYKEGIALHFGYRRDAIIYNSKTVSLNLSKKKAISTVPLVRDFLPLSSNLK